MEQRKRSETFGSNFRLTHRDKPVSMTVDHIALMKSDRGKNGMIYTELGTVSADI